MTHRRSEIRAALREAFAASAYFEGINLLPAWASSIDANSLPCLGILTPRESVDADAHDSCERTVTVAVAVKRRGGDAIEDTLDADSDQIEALVIAAIRALDLDVFLDLTSIDIDGAPQQRIGTLTMSFRVLVRTPEPLIP